jgi:hypothetical protein
VALTVHLGVFQLEDARKKAEAEEQSAAEARFKELQRKAQEAAAL